MIFMEKVIVKDAIVKLRLNPSSQSEVSDEVFHGMKLMVEGEVSGGWIKVRTEYDYFGYLQKDSVISDEEIVGKWKCRRIITGLFADVLVNPKTQSKIIETLPMGSYVLVRDDVPNNGYVNVALADGRDGWMREGFLSAYSKKEIFEDLNDLRSDILDIAKKFIGAQYRWGGKTYSGIDCSGLCFMAYFLNGINIYRDAKIMEGFPVKQMEFASARMADMLYFPGHMGIYIGDGLFIHSSLTEDGVTVSSLNPNDACYRKDLADELMGAGSVFI